MAGQIRMTPETMRIRAQQTDNYHNEFDGVVRNMDQLLSNLKTEWEGKAVEGYEARYNQIKRTAFKQTQELFDEIASNLRKTAQIIETTDREIGAQFQG